MNKNQYDYRSKGSFDRYRRIVSGAGWGKLVKEQIILNVFSQLPGPIGLILRRITYFLILNQFGTHSVIDRSVEIRCPSQIKIGEGCIIESYVNLLAGSSCRCSIILQDDSYIRSFSVLNAGAPDGYIKLGNRSNLAHHVIIHGHGGVDIGTDVMIAAGCSIVASMHIHDDIEKPIKDQGATATGIKIGNGAWLGTGTKVLDGVSIGNGSIIGAGSVVIDSIPDFAVATGVPAEVKRFR